MSDMNNNTKDLFTKEDRLKVFEKIKQNELNDNSQQSGRKFKLFQGQIIPLAATFSIFIVFLGLLLTTTITEKEGNNDRQQGNTIQPESTYSFLLLVKDKASRTNVHFLAKYKNQEKSLDLVLLPNDSYVPIVDNEGEFIKNDKLSNVYAINSEPESVMRSVSELLQGPIDYYAVLNENKFKEIINQIGGINFYIKNKVNIRGENGDSYQLEPSIINHLSGHEVLTLLSSADNGEEGGIIELDQLNLATSLVNEIKSKSDSVLLRKLLKEHVETNIPENKLNELIGFNTISTFDLSKDSKVEEVEGIKYKKLNKKTLQSISEKLFTQ